MRDFGLCAFRQKQTTQVVLDHDGKVDACSTLVTEDPEEEVDDVALFNPDSKKGLPVGFMHDLFPDFGYPTDGAGTAAGTDTARRTEAIAVLGMAKVPISWVEQPLLGAIPRLSIPLQSDKPSVLTASVSAGHDESVVTGTAQTQEAIFNSAFKSAVRDTQQAHRGGAELGAAHSKIQARSIADWGMDPVAAVARMTRVAAAVYFTGRRPTTLSSQDSAVRGWLYFCETFGFQPWPASEMSLILFTIWSASRVSPDSIRKYISSIRVRHVEEEAVCPDNKQMPRLMRVLDGLDWIYKAKVGKRIRLPCTLDVLVKLLTVKWRNENALEPGSRPSIYSMSSVVMSSAVYTLAFLAATRPSEIAVRHNLAKKYTSLPLRLKDVRLFNREGQPYALVLQLPSRKTDQLGEKSDIAIGLTGHPLVCSISRFRDYLDARRLTGEELTEESLLFPIMGDDNQLAGLTYEQLTSQMDADLESAGFNSTLYGGHSWRIGAATTLAMNGVPEYIIKDMGGWSRTSTAFNTYIARTSQEQRASFSAFFVRPYAAESHLGVAGFWSKMADSTSL